MANGYFNGRPPDKFEHVPFSAFVLPNEAAPRGINVGVQTL